MSLRELWARLSRALFHFFVRPDERSELPVTINKRLDDVFYGSGQEQTINKSHDHVKKRSSGNRLGLQRFDFSPPLSSSVEEAATGGISTRRCVVQENVLFVDVMYWRMGRWLTHPVWWRWGLLSKHFLRLDEEKKTSRVLALGSIIISMERHLCR